MALNEYSLLEDVCKLMKVSKSTMLRLNDEKKLPFYKLRGKLYVKESEVEKVLIKGCQGCK